MAWQRLQYPVPSENMECINPRDLCIMHKAHRQLPAGKSVGVVFPAVMACVSRDCQSPKGDSVYV